MQRYRALGDQHPGIAGALCVPRSAEVMFHRGVQPASVKERRLTDDALRARLHKPQGVRSVLIRFERVPEGSCTKEELCRQPPEEFGTPDRL